MKIKVITVQLSTNPGGRLVNAAARDESGQLRGDITSQNMDDVRQFIADWQEHAETVEIENEANSQTSPNRPLPALHDNRL